MTLTNEKVQGKKFKIKKKKLKFLSKSFVDNGKQKLFPNNSSFLTNLKNAKTNTIMTI